MQPPSSPQTRRLSHRELLWKRIKQLTLQLLQACAGDHVLDIGCGTGDDVRELARMVGPGGRAVGIDSSNIMIAGHSVFSIEYTYDSVETEH